jgi:hypothetical protein
MLVSRALIHDEGRREGRAPIAPMVRVQQKARGRTTGTDRIIRPSLRDWLYGLYALSPGPAFLPPSSKMLVNKHRELGLSSGRPGPHDFTVRAMSFVRV